MLGFAVRRVALLVATAWLVASAVFLLGQFARGDYVTQTMAMHASADAVARARARQGLDRPLLERYVHWVTRASRLDLGTSVRYQQPVAPLVAQRGANTLLLGGAALVVAAGIGLWAGLLVGSRPRTGAAAIARAVSTVCLSCPPLLASILLVWVAAITGLAPVSGLQSADRAGGLLARLADVAWHLPVPVLALALPFAAVIERVTSQAVAQALAEPSVVAARARGVSERDIRRRHALRLGAAPILAVGGTLAGTILSGSFAVELVTSWPGLGRLTYEALVARDADLAAGCAIVAALLLGVAVLAADAVLAAVDPRVTLDRGAGSEAS
jgi:peptide/nickel transport system permease protein